MLQVPSTHWDTESPIEKRSTHFQKHPCSQPQWQTEELGYLQTIVNLYSDVFCGFRHFRMRTAAMKPPHLVVMEGAHPSAVSAPQTSAAFSPVRTSENGYHGTRYHFFDRVVSHFAFIGSCPIFKSAFYTVVSHVPRYGGSRCWTFRPDLWIRIPLHHPAIPTVPRVSQNAGAFGRVS